MSAHIDARQLLEDLAAGKAPAEPLGLYIDGAWTPAADGATFESSEPATGKPWIEVSEAGPDDVDRAVGAARRALSGPWASTIAADRARVLWSIGRLVNDNLDVLSRLESRDNGKAVRETRAELTSVVRYFEYFAGICQQIAGRTVPATGPFFSYTRLEPIGVVAAIIPWNSPITMMAWKVCPALAAGNTVVLKPAEDTPVSAWPSWR